MSTSSQLGHVTKEQIHAAFQKAQMSYHKYRGRYSDLSRHYRELERENAKMKVFLKFFRVLFISFSFFLVCFNRNSRQGNSKGLRIKGTV